jgi:hypothetical protein
VSAINVLVAAAVSFIVLLLGKVSLDLMSKELQGQAEQLPHRILRLAARRLPPKLRAQYSEEWEAELDYILKRHDALPITRLLLGFRFATSLLRGARQLRAHHMGADAPKRRWAGRWVVLPDGRRVYIERQRLVAQTVWIFLRGQCGQVTRSGALCRCRVRFPHTRCHRHRKTIARVATSSAYQTL